MKCLTRLRSWLKWMANHQRLETQMDAEMHFHIESYAADLIRCGVQRDEAMRRARIDFGGIESHKDAARASVGIRWVDELWADLHFGMRVLLKSPGFTSIAVISLALGIGANTAIFILAKAALLDTLNVRHPDQLRLLAWTQDERSVVPSMWGDFYSDAKGRTVAASFSYPVYQELLHRTRSLGELFAFRSVDGFDRLTATIDDHAQTVTGELVSGNYFRELGVGTILGRPIEPTDDTAPGAGPVAVISDTFWERRFNRLPSVIGKTLNLNLVPVTIIGVAPRGFTGASHVHQVPDLFLPLSMQPLILPKGKGSLLSDPDIWWLQIMGRLQPGVSEDAARASLAVTLEQAVRATLDVAKDKSMPPLHLLHGNHGWNYAVSDEEGPISILISLAVFVLLLACANIANLLLAQSSSRQREVSIRLALGAGKTRILRQMLTESLMLSTLGGSAGLLIAYAGRDVIPRLISGPWGPNSLRARFDWRVFVFALTISVFTGLLFGVGPARQAMRTSVTAGIKDGGATTTLRVKSFVGKTLVALQVSLCMLLLVGAGLFIRTLANLDSVDPGFQKNGLLLFAIAPPQQRYPAPKDIQLLHQLEERFASLPSVQLVTLSHEPFLAHTASNDGFYPDDQPRKRGPEQTAWSNSVGQLFFQTMGIAIRYGRAFDSGDTPTSPKVAIINEALAARDFVAKNPVGMTFRTNEQDRYEIIGVCANAKYAELRDDAPPTFYVLFTQQKNARDGMTFEVRTKGDPGSSVGEVRNTLQSIDKDLPLIDVRTQVEQIEATTASERIFAALTTGFGIVALILATIGVYGVMAGVVARRVNEIGIRMALGAQKQEILRMILRQASSLAVFGIVSGLGAALLLTRFLRSMLFGLKPTDPFTLVGAAILLFSVALLAGWRPARRAARVQPMQALRHE